MIGVVTARVGGGEAYRVDIGSAHPAQLDGLAFESATKRNRPMLKVDVFNLFHLLPHIYVGCFIGWLACICTSIPGT